MHRSQQLKLSVVIFCGLLLAAASVAAADDWLQQLKGSQQPGRIFLPPTEAGLPGRSISGTVRMGHGTFFLESDFLPRIDGPRGHVLIQLLQPLDSVIEQELRALGVELFEYIPENTWKALVPATEVSTVKALAGVHALGNIYPVDKFPTPILERGLTPYSRHADGTISVLVSFYRDISFQRAENILVDLGGSTTQNDFFSGHRILLKIPAERLSDLAQHDEVSWIENKPPPKANDNADAATLSKVDELHNTPYNLNGLAVPGGIWDGGEVQAGHPDLAGRVMLVDTSGVSSHATHVAGTMVSSGIGNAAAKGMAPAADLYSYDNSGDVPAEMSAAYSNYALIMANHSWSFITGWRYNFYDDGRWVWFGDDNFGNYTSTSQAWDQTIVDTGLIVVKSAGNDRDDDGDQASSGHRHYDEPGTLYYDYHPPDGDYDCIGQIGSSKNVITVGAVYDNAAMTSYSSYGPADDGRIKPDLVANGDTLLSTCPTSTYCTMGGTSMATPVVSGAVALVAQHYAQVMGADPTPEMIKALLAGSAFELGTDGPEYDFGWGLLNARTAVDLVQNGTDAIRQDSVSNGGIQEYPLILTSRDKFVRVTAAWTDPPGSPAAADALVNDIDLELVSPSSTSYLPWVLDDANPNQPAATGINTVDNIEQVQLTFPEAGTWTIRVKGTAIQGSQSFALATVLSDEFQVNSSYDWSEEIPTAAGLANGGFVVVWDSSDLFYTIVDTYGRVFDAQGYPVADDFRLNQTTADKQKNSAVAALSGGGFAAVWDSDGQDGSLEGVYGRVFDNVGNATSAEFRVNDYTNLAQEDPAAAGLADGGFVIAWESRMQDSSDWGVFVRLFSADGSPITGDIQVNTTTFFDQSEPCLAALQSGGFAVAWKSYNQDGSWYGIFGRVFDAAGNPQTSEFQINTYTPSSQYPCAAAALEGGGFVVVWKSYGQDGDQGGIFGQMFDSSGNKVGGEFQVNTYTQDEQAHPSVSPLPNGGFIIFWQSEGQDKSFDGIFARKYDSSGNPEAAEYQVNLYNVHNQAAPCSAALTSGDVLSAWEGVIQGRGKEIFARVLKTAAGCPGDFDQDGDVDGSDLAEYASNPAAMDTADFALNFGHTDCS